jgi:hypothetical protein
MRGVVLQVKDGEQRKRWRGVAKVKNVIGVWVAGWIGGNSCG